MKKKLAALFFAGIMAFSAVSPVFAADDITVYLNMRELAFDQPPIIQDGRTLVPVRAIFEALGAEVTWDGDTKTVKSSKGNDFVSVTIGENLLYKNGEPVEIDVPAQIVNDRTLVPLRAVSEAYGCQVNWDEVLRKVFIDFTETEPQELNGDYALYIPKIEEYKNAIQMSLEEFDEKYIKDESPDCSSINADIIRHNVTIRGPVNYSYALTDINGNGIQELLITDGRSIIDMYTIKEEKLVKIFENCSYGYKTRMYALSDGRILIDEDGGSGLSKFRLGTLSTDGTAFEPKEGYFGNDPNAYMPVEVMDGYTLISIGEYKEMLSGLMEKSVLGTAYWRALV